MKILIITDTFEPEINGVITSVRQFSEVLAGWGHKVYIFCPKYGNEKDKRQKNIFIKRFYSFKLVSYENVRLVLPDVYRLAREIKKIDPDVVHIQTPMMLGVTALLALRYLKMDHVETYHSYVPDMMVYLRPGTMPGIRGLAANEALKKIKSTLISDVVLDRSGKIALRPKDEGIVAGYQKEEKRGKATDKLAWDVSRLYYNKAKIVITPSNILKDELEKNGITRPISVVSNGIDTSFYTKKTDYSPKYKIVHVGRLGYEKKVEEVLQAFVLAKKKIKDLRLDIIGDGPASSMLKREAERLGVGESVKFLGFVDRKTLKDSYANYDFLVTASPMETQGLVILEAMSAGLAALGVNKLAVPELIRDGVNGYISSSGAPEAMAENIIKMYETEGRLEDFGQKSLGFSGEHGLEECAKKLLMVYEKAAPHRVVKPLIEKKKKTILYFSMSMGSGHRMTVNALVQALNKYYPDKFEQHDVSNEDVELFRSQNLKVYKVLESFYKAMTIKAPVAWKTFFEISNSANIYETLERLWFPALKKDVRMIVETIDPDVIISTFPFIDRFMNRIIKDYKRRIMLGVVVTDTGKVHRGWISPMIDFCFAPTNDTKDSLIKRGMDPGKVHFLGFPVQQDFYKQYSKADERKKLGLDQSKKTIVYFAGGYGLGNIFSKVKALDSYNRGIQIVVMCGNNKNLLKKIMSEKYENYVLPLGFTDKPAEILATADLVITKAGGISIMELITFKKPMIVTEVTPGQEEPNADFVARNGFGFICKNPDDLGKKSAELLTGSGLSELEKNLEKYHGNEEADKKIADFIYKTLYKKE